MIRGLGAMGKTLHGHASVDHGTRLLARGACLEIGPLSRKWAKGVFETHACLHHTLDRLRYSLGVCPTWSLKSVVICWR
jgi:hypothetical protein